VQRDSAPVEQTGTEPGRLTTERIPGLIQMNSKDNTSQQGSFEQPSQPALFSLDVLINQRRPPHQNSFDDWITDFVYQQA
jgi:hypothetical protein